MPFAKSVVVVFAVLLAFLIFRKPLVNHAHCVVSRVERQLHRRDYTVGEIKSALSQSYRLSAAIANGWGSDKSQLHQMIRAFLRDDGAVVAVEVRDANGGIVEGVVFKGETHVFPATHLSNRSDAPVLSVADGNRVDVQRVICVGSNVVGVLSMRRQTTVQLKSNDIEDFLRYGDGGTQ